VPRKVFVAGEILTAADVNTNLMDQAVMSFAGTAARGSAIPSPVEGMAAYLEDSNILSLYDGSAWKNSLGVTGGILQVVSTAKTDTFTTTSSTYTVVTGLTATITPKSATSKILVLVQLAYGLVSNNGWGNFKVTGGNTSVYVGDTAGSRVRAVFGGTMGADGQGSLLSSSINFLDSPATTSATTYQVEARIAAGGAVFVNRPPFDTDGEIITRGASSITLMEVTS
jgi:hypothetical protein